MDLYSVRSSLLFYYLSLYSIRSSVLYFSSQLYSVRGTVVIKPDFDYELKNPVYVNEIYLTSSGFYIGGNNVSCYLCKLNPNTAYTISRNKKSSRFRICLNEVNPLIFYLDFNSSEAKCKPSYFVDNSSIDDLTAEITTGDKDIYLTVYYTNTSENDIVISVTPKEA